MAPAAAPDKSEHTPALLAEAINLARRGLSIIPVTGKKAALPWKPFQQAPADEKQLKCLFDRPDLTGLAIVLGRPSGGLAVRDFDVPDSYHAWAAEHPDEAASLPTVETARGFHVLGRLEEETFADLGDGELRGDAKHYVVAPPSLHPSGQVYKWLTPLPDELPLLPPSLTGREQPKQPQQPKQHIACVPRAVVDAVVATLPTGPGQRNHKLFELARRLKSIPGLDTSPAMLRAVVVMWFERALPVIRTKELQESWADFQLAWVRARPHGAALTAAYDAARRRPLPPVDGDGEVGVLAALCRNLGGASRQFFLSCRAVEALFGVGRMTAWRWLVALQFHGVIEEVEKGKNKNRQATVWRYKGV
jgi:Bifunctional DNA primase/polymerase, N-terminal